MQKKTYHTFKNPILIISSGILLLTALYIFFFTEQFYFFIEEGSIWVRERFGAFYLWLGLATVLFLLVIAFSKVGRLKLGDTKPEFNRWSWIAMLYSAGMGAGILLRCVQEPVFMYLHNPIKNGASSKIVGLEFTFYQWGFTAWAFYGVFALLVAYAVFIRKRHVRLGTSLP
ncbi:MAG: BCCT family transporter, partial [Gillisia sp.]